MKWIPKDSITSQLTPRLNVEHHLKDPAFDFEKGDFSVDDGNHVKTVSGMDSFIQQIQKVLLSDTSGLYPDGLQEFLPTSNDQTIFDQECLGLATRLASHQYVNSTSESPNGLGFYINEIHSMERFLKNGKSYLLLQMSISGESDLITVTVPIHLLHLQQS